MKLQRTTLLLLLVALGFAGIVYVVEIQGQQREEARIARSKNIFAFTEDQVQQVKISQPNREMLVFERQAGEDLQWMMKEPRSTVASNASVAFLLDKLANSQSDRTLTVSADQLAEYGLDNPTATVDITLNNGTTHQLVLGKLDFSESLIYAQIDPPVTTVVKDDTTTPKSASLEPTATEAPSLEVVLVPIDFQYAVDRPLSEWEQQEAERPIEASPSPNLNINPSPTPETEANPNLNISPSPTPETEANPNFNISPSPTPEPEANPNFNISPSPTPETEASP